MCSYRPTTSLFNVAISASGRHAGDSDLDHARNLAHEYLGFFENYRADCQRSDTLLIKYRELVEDPCGLSERLNGLLGTSVSQSGDPTEFLKGHRTSASLAQSLDRWQKERLSPKVAAFLEQHLREPMTVLGCEFAQSQSDGVLGCDFTQLAGQKLPIPATVASQGSLSAAGNDGLQLTVTGDDLNFLVPGIKPFAATDINEVWMCLAGDVGDHCSIYWRNPRGGFSEEQSMHVSHNGGTHWRVVRFLVGKHPQWKGQIAELRVDPLNGERPATPRTGHLRWLRLVG